MSSQINGQAWPKAERGAGGPPGVRAERSEGESLVATYEALYRVVLRAVRKKVLHPGHLGVLAEVGWVHVAVTELEELAGLLRGILQGDMSSVTLLRARIQDVPRWPMSAAIDAPDKRREIPDGSVRHVDPFGLVAVGLILDRLDPEETDHRWLERVIGFYLSRSAPVQAVFHAAERVRRGGMGIRAFAELFTAAKPPAPSHEEPGPHADELLPPFGFGPERWDPHMLRWLRCAREAARVGVEVLDVGDVPLLVARVEPEAVCQGYVGSLRLYPRPGARFPPQPPVGGGGLLLSVGNQVFPLAIASGGWTETSITVQFPQGVPSGCATISWQPPARPLPDRLAEAVGPGFAECLGLFPPSTPAAARSDLVRLGIGKPPEVVFHAEGQTSVVAEACTDVLLTWEVDTGLCGSGGRVTISSGSQLILADAPLRGEMIVNEHQTRTYTLSAESTAGTGACGAAHATVTITRETRIHLSIPDKVYYPGHPVPVNVRISCPAPAGGLTVTLISDSPPILPGGTAVIPSGKAETLVALTVPGPAVGTVRITGSAPGYQSGEAYAVINTTSCVAARGRPPEYYGGKWNEEVPIPGVVGVHLAVLHTGEVLIFNYDEGDEESTLKTCDDTEAALKAGCDADHAQRVSSTCNIQCTGFTDCPGACNIQCTSFTNCDDIQCTSFTNCDDIQCTSFTNCAWYDVPCHIARGACVAAAAIARAACWVARGACVAAAAVARAACWVARGACVAAAAVARATCIAGCVALRAACVAAAAVARGACIVASEVIRIACRAAAATAGVVCRLIVRRQGVLLGALVGGAVGALLGALVGGPVGALVGGVGLAVLGAWLGGQFPSALGPTGVTIAHSSRAKCAIWNPATGAVRLIPLKRNLFCSGHCFLPDGRLFVAGGQFPVPILDGEIPISTPGSHGGAAHHDLHLLDPTNMTWFRIRPPHEMKEGRWYPTVLTLADGKAMVISGNANIFADTLGIKNSLQIFDPMAPKTPSSSKRRPTEAFGPPQGAELPKGPWKIYHMYPFCHVLPSKEVFIHWYRQTATYNPQSDVANWDSPGARGTWRAHWIPAGETWIETNRPVSRTGPGPGTSVLLPLIPRSGADGKPDYGKGRVMIIGGGGVEGESDPRTLGDDKLDYDDPATNTAEILDFAEREADGFPRWRYTGRNPANPGAQPTETTSPMHNPRVMPDAVLLPDGKVVVINGAKRGRSGGFLIHFGSKWGAKEHVAEPEIFDPEWETWERMCATKIERYYHATAALLPDGRVVVAGHDGYLNLPTGQPPQRQSEYRLETFSPPYLFRGPRPQIRQADVTVSYSSVLVVETDDIAAIASVALIRQSSITHQTNTDQRYVRLAIVDSDRTRLYLQAPPHAGVAPPGYYMLFVVSRIGVPSVARWVRVG